MGTEPVAVALHVEKVGMMQNPVQDGGYDYCIVKDPCPFLERTVAGYDYRLGVRTPS